MFVDLHQMQDCIQYAQCPVKKLEYSRCKFVPLRIHVWEFHRNRTYAKSPTNFSLSSRSTHDLWVANDDKLKFVGPFLPLLLSELLASWY